MSLSKNKFICILTALILASISSAFPQKKEIQFITKELKVSINDAGLLTSLFDRIHKKEYLPANLNYPLVQIRVGEKFYQPSSASFASSTGILKLSFANDVALYIKAHEKNTHITFEVVKVVPSSGVDYLIWGPIPTTIKETVGEVIGVVRDPYFSIGIQGLNVKTLGGFPFNDEAFDMSRTRAAEAKEFGSVIQAYSIDRSKPRSINVWLDQWQNMPVEPLPEENIVGSKIALFGCATAYALDRIGEIEIAEGLPHPIVDGVWIKKSKEASRSYLIADFSESNIDELLNYTKLGNFRALYHMEPWVSWGHFKLREDLFPNGVKGFKDCTEKARKMNIRLGAHTLTNFINTNDPYVTPVPDNRLVKTGYSALAEDINETTTEISVASPEYFNNEKANWLHTVVIDDELIRYRKVTDSAPFKLIDCQRGSFNTKASSHNKNSTIGKLADHPYKVFFPNINLQREIAKNLAVIFRETGLSQMDFDGSEGCAATGQGDYGFELFAKDFYDSLGDHVVLNGTSNSEHFYWHINTYCNWGEPWYEGFREGMQQYRLDNQGLFDRNFMPHMLGWYILNETTSLSDIEWMLARGAYYNAGFALSTNLNAIKTNPDTKEILSAIKEWEDARLSGSFAKEVLKKMSDPHSEFHFEKVSGGWSLFPINSSKDFTHQKIIKQPGEPTFSLWEFENINDETPLHLKLKVTGQTGIIRNPVFEVDNYSSITFPVELNVGQSLLFEGGTVIRIYDEKGRQIKSINTNVPIPKLSTGKHIIAFNCEFASDSNANVTVSFKTIGKPEFIQKK